MSYCEYEFFTKNEIDRSWLISILSDFGFEGFEETKDSLKAFAPKANLDEDKIKEVLSTNELAQIKCSITVLEDKNWNEEWEKNFEPVLIAGKVGIRAPFHPKLAAEYDIIIEPKMSFGTGHHATTAQVMELMLMENFVNKSVLDFGCGTGVLAILASKLKAAKIVAADNDDWAYNNSVENIALNNCVNVEVYKANSADFTGNKFDIVLANINRNVILDCIDDWQRILSAEGILMISGFLESNEKDILAKTEALGLKIKQKLSRNGWMAMTLQSA